MFNSSVQFLVQRGVIMFICRYRRLRILCRGGLIWFIWFCGSGRFIIYPVFIGFCCWRGTLFLIWFIWFCGSGRFIIYTFFIGPCCWRGTLFLIWFIWFCGSSRFITYTVFIGLCCWQGTPLSGLLRFHSKFRGILTSCWFILSW